MRNSVYKLHLRKCVLHFQVLAIYKLDILYICDFHDYFTKIVQFRQKKKQCLCIF